MIQVRLPDNHTEERRYAVEILLGTLLGLEFECSFSSENHATELLLENGNALTIEDHFFCKSKEYRSIESLPQKATWQSKTTNPFLPENDLPILFGTDRFEVSIQKITCGNDLIAGTFFMLSRWEEIVIADRDAHGRFPAAAAFSVNHGFHHRPVVNEMAEMLWSVLLHLGIRQTRKQRAFEVLLTCDVDAALLWKSPGFFWKKLAGDLFKRRDLRAVVFDVKSYWRTSFQHKKDPYDTFDFLMESAEQQGLNAHFFFLSGGNSKYDRPLPPDSPFVKSLLQKIKKRGHVAGFHPSYHSLQQKEIWGKERQSLEAALGGKVTGGRQHFLHFETPHTWQAWEDQSMTWDSTLYFPEKAGFRCGICSPFPVFNVLTRTKLRLLEIPLTAMEVTWKNYQKAAPEVMWSEISTLLETVKKYNGTFVLLWHNSSFNTPEWQPYTWVFEKIMRCRGDDI